MPRYENTRRFAALALAALLALGIGTAALAADDARPRPRSVTPT